MRPGALLVALLALVAPAIGRQQDLQDLCQSPIFCQGDMLRTVQMSRIYKDSKTYVDLRAEHEEEEMVANFEKFMRSTNNQPKLQDIERFVEENFKNVTQLTNVMLEDWQENPAILNRIEDDSYREWASALNSIWKDLARKINTDVRDNPKKNSLIYVNNTFVVPGGRFEEFYYWDSYWVIEGLLLCGMTETSKGMIENFLSMVKTYGFIPNGGRVYYLMRSQPPLLIPMIDLYYKATDDWDFVDKNLVTLEKEFSYWLRYKSIKVKKNGREYMMTRYFVNSEGPRPESYREDYVLAEKISDPDKKRAFYKNVKAAAESGWDFSARWFIAENGDPSLDLDDAATEDIVPVDLNSFMEKNARILAGFYRNKNKPQKTRYYMSLAQQYREAIQAVLWNEADGTWYDYDTRHQKQRAFFYPSNLTPLYTTSYNPNLAPEYAQRAVDYLQANGIADYPGGIPTSLDNSSQQWDFPNAWPPLQSIVVQGLRRTRYPPAMQVAKQLAFTWLKSNYVGFDKTKKMYEKYDATQLGKYGGGGEYTVQDGFGWTNGVVLEFLDVYPWATPDTNDDGYRSRAGVVKVHRKVGLGHNPKTHHERLVLKSIWTHYNS